VFPLSDGFDDVDVERLDREELTEALQDEAIARYEGREEELGAELMREVERYLLLEIIDQRWQEHLYDMDYLQQGIYLRGAAQIDPLVAYKNEAFDLFQDLMHSVWHDFARFIYHVEVTLQDEAAMQQAAAPPPSRPSVASSSATGGGRVSYSGAAQSGAAAITAAAAGLAEPPRVDAPPGQTELAGPAMEPVQQRIVDADQQIGRNDPCWCGSGKKYKKCHGA
jgi:preprotein translocase subunit SecA